MGLRSSRGPVGDAEDVGDGMTPEERKAMRATWEFPLDKDLRDACEAIETCLDALDKAESVSSARWTLLEEANKTINALHGRVAELEAALKGYAGRVPHPSVKPAQTLTTESLHEHGDIKAWINWETLQSQDDEVRDDLLSKVALIAVTALDRWARDADSHRHPACKALAAIRNTLRIEQGENHEH